MNNVFPEFSFQLPFQFYRLEPKKLPTFVSIGSSDGKNAEILPQSTDISKIDNVRILDPGFEYSSDKTLRPEAFVSPIISVVNSNTITAIDVD